MSGPVRWAAAALLAAALAGGWMWWSSPERQIRRTFAALADGLSHQQASSPLAAASAAAGIQPLLAHDVVIEPGRRLQTISGRSAVLGAAARVLTAVPALQVEFVDLEVNVSPDGGGASVTGTASTTMTDRAGQQRTDAREFEAEMRLVDGRWVVSRARAVDALEPVS